MNQKIRTSSNSPLQIASVTFPSGNGLIGMTLCPGKKDKYSINGPWERDLQTDLTVVQEWGAQALVSLMEEHEFDLLGVPEMGRMASELGLTWFHLPIPDVQPPGGQFKALWPNTGTALHQILDAGGRIVVHCRGGLGRTGVVAAQLLVERGMAIKEAIRVVREARPGAIQTSGQEKYLLAL